MSKPEHDRTIDYIEFGATDIEATKRFYAACFGWKFTDYGPDYVAVRRRAADRRLHHRVEARRRAAGRAVCQQAGGDLRHRESAARPHRARDLQLSRRTALSLSRSERQRAGSMGRLTSVARSVQRHAASRSPLRNRSVLARPPLDDGRAARAMARSQRAHDLPRHRGSRCLGSADRRRGGRRLSAAPALRFAAAHVQL